MARYNEQEFRQLGTALQRDSSGYEIGNRKFTLGIDPDTKQSYYDEVGGAFAPAPEAAPTRLPRESAGTKAINDLKTALEADRMKYDSDQKAAREEVYNLLRGRLDDVDRRTQEKLTLERQAGEKETARARGINVRTGNIGTPFGEGRRTLVDNANKQAEKTVLDEGQSERSRLQATAEGAVRDIDTSFRDRLDKIRQERAGLIEKGVAFAESDRKAVDENIKRLAASGISLEDFHKTPTYEQLKELTGQSDLELDAFFNASKPKIDAKDITYQKLGDSKVAAFWVGTDGTLKKKEYDFEIPQEKDLKVIEGVPYIYDPKTQILEPAKGFTPKPKASTANAGGEPIKTADGKEIAYGSAEYVPAILDQSSGGKAPAVNERQALTKSFTVLNQLDALQSSISNEQTGPIIGAIRSKNPYDTKAQTIKAQLTAIVPNLARGVFGEVGVLTDNDVALYSKTLANLTSTEDVRKAITAITLKTVQNSIENQFEVLAASGIDVSGFKQKYLNMRGKVQQLERELGVQGEAFVTVISPDGTKGTIPKDQLEAAKKVGYKLAQ